MWPGETRFESCWWQFFFVLFFTFWYVMHYISFSCSDFEKLAKIDVQNSKISRLSLLVSRPWRGPLRHVYGYTNHSTTMVHTFLESPSNLDVHLKICFWIFEKFRRKWRLKYTIWGPLRYVCGQTINPTSMICTFLESPTDLDVHPRKCFALLAKIVEIDVAEVGTQNNEIWS